MKSKLPLLNYINELYPVIDLDNVLIIAGQHILQTTADLFDALIDRGLNPKDIYLLGKCYSTNLDIYKRLLERGINVSPLSLKYDSYKSFDKQYKEYVISFLGPIRKKINKKNYRCIIVLDDGGYLIRYMNTKFRVVDGIIGIEQTSSGFESVKDIELKFPVINVARSDVKLKMEAPFIADVVYKKIRHYLREQKINAKIVVVGFGAIGQCIYKKLKSNYSVVKYDILSDGKPFSDIYKKDLQRFTVIVGATGKTIMLPRDIKKLKAGAVLISASSSDREFSAEYFRRMNIKTSNCHKDISVSNVHILNSGFPINFDGAKNSVIPKKIQLTRALLLSAVFEALTGNARGGGLLELNFTLQKKIANKFKNILKA